MARGNTNGHAAPAASAVQSPQWLVKAPGDTCDSGYARDRVEVTALTGEQSEALKRLTCSLRQNNLRCRRRDARTADGKVVDNEADAVRWLLDRLAEHYAEAH